MIQLHEMFFLRAGGRAVTVINPGQPARSDNYHHPLLFFFFLPAQRNRTHAGKDLAAKKEPDVCAPACAQDDSAELLVFGPHSRCRSDLRGEGGREEMAHRMERLLPSRCEGQETLITGLTGISPTNS